jgi:hypothetical protein
LLARIYEILQLVCPNCHTPMRIITFITEGSSVIKKESASPRRTNLSPRIAPARRPSLWEAVVASVYAKDPEWASWHSQNPRSSLIKASLGDSNFAHPGSIFAPNLV